MADSNIRLRDAEGREIPLNTTALYDKNGSRREVDFFKFYPDTDRWNIVFKDSYSHFSPQNLSITQPDSWEKLLDDLDNAVKGGDNAECCYMRREDIEVGTQCPGCRLYEQGKDKFNECSYLAYADIAARIRRLMGEDE